MNVGVRYLAQLRRLVGHSAERLELPGPCTVAGLVATVLERYPRLRPGLVGEGQIHPSILVFVGDEQASQDRPLSDGDEVSLLAPIAGGA